MMTVTAKVDRWNPNPDVIAEAAEIIKAGGLVAFPTETVYGLGADALNTQAVSSIFTAKGRPQDNPLIVHVYSLEQAESAVHMNDSAYRLARTFWPGPLTLVLPSRDIIPAATRAGLSTAAVRMPDNPTARALIFASGTMIAAPSANTSGRPSPTDAETVLHDMAGKIDMILDGGSVKLGIESTVIDLTDAARPLMLRPGGMPREVIEAELGRALEVYDTGSMKRSPGTRYRHYAPDIPVVIWRKGEKLTGDYAYMGMNIPDGVNMDRAVIFSSAENFAHGLFAGLRRLEREDVSYIAVEWPEEESGLAEGLRDRISRSAGHI
ncbi:MAG: threonylcarbamoyl-AMP synthase [Synergistaceae bacterium]|nr:threonylcarbamoyl-AMP synthase [Synergistaceae bacterium]